MALLPIVKHPNDVLETKCEEVTSFDRNLAKLLNNMYDTMVKADGVGLAAPQVNVAKRIAVVEVDEDFGKIELINPVILESKGSDVDIEGCLSFPGIYGEVERPNYVKVRAQNRKGGTYILEAEGFLARAIQHEMDHLDGILFTSKVTRYIDEEELEGFEEA